ncbi:hypothetical protein KPH14_003039 [Odynerus spinipes]|uniref:Uncharacterized protein n=1 Tax=Odynerus spinipes TaxID=1348599 RepID=A0AAD9RX99_9HYME|nr:hypothetical protein KPH14_003039 [Odynerus spinipes]
MVSFLGTRCKCASYVETREQGRAREFADVTQVRARQTFSRSTHLKVWTTASRTSTTCRKSIMIFEDPESLIVPHKTTEIPVPKDEECRSRNREVRQREKRNCEVRQREKE